MTGANVLHATVITRRSDRRIMGKPGERVTICGGPVTEMDQLCKDFQKGWAPAGWTQCQTCGDVLAQGERDAKAGIYR